MGANDRVEVARKHTILGAWLSGRLGGMADPKSYPELSALLGEDEVQADEAPSEDEDPDAAHVGAKLWIMFLNKK